MVVFLLALGAPLRAQENLDLGKSPAQLFASDCAICHKSPQGLAAKGGGILGLEGFLREHYTASRETATAIAGYLRAAGNAPAASGRTGKGKGKGKKSDDKSKAVEKKSGTAQPGDAKSGDAKSGDAKSGDAKSGEPKTAEPKTKEPKSSEPKSSESKSAKPKTAKPKTAKPKQDEGGKSD